MQTKRENGVKAKHAEVANRETKGLLAEKGETKKESMMMQEKEAKFD